MIAERDFARSIFHDTFLGSPQEPVWKWADRKIFFDQKQTAQMDRYDSSVTPWVRDIQDAIRDPETKEVTGLKSSQTGLSQGALNAIAYMPEHCPGNVLYAINSKEKGSDVANIRLGPLLKKLAGSQLSEDPNDFATLTMRLKNMVVKVSGSGSASPVRETWYRVVVIDEPEDFEQLPDGSFYDLVKSRFATVADATLFVIGKPQLEATKKDPKSGIIHRCFLKGSQEHWRLPCPHCPETFVFRRDHFQYHQHQSLEGEWDLAAMEAPGGVWYKTPCCGERIDEHQKYELVKQGQWVPAELKDRMKLSNEPVAAEPGVRSFHINDYYSNWPEVTWGKLFVKWVQCTEINPNSAQREDYIKNHDGLPIAPKEIYVASETINALRGGITERITIDQINEDGTNDKITREQILGHRFGLSYNQEGKRINDLPIKPVALTISVDRQDEFYKWTVIAWSAASQSYLVDFGISNTDGQLLGLRKRPYYFEGKKYFIFGGGVDRGHKSKVIYSLCQRSIRMGWPLVPLLGWGQKHERYLTDPIEKRTTTLQNGEVMEYIRFHDHSIKIDFYSETIQRRTEPRLWMPDPVPHDIVTELTSEYWDPDLRKFVHPDGAAPNDYGDTLKMQLGVIWPVFSPLFD